MLSSRKAADKEQQQRIEELEKELYILKNTKPRIVVDDPYELLLMCNLYGIDAKHRDSLEAGTSKILNKTTKDLLFKRLLDQFPAQTVKEQRDALRKFLADHPALRTMNMELLFQRVYMWKHYHSSFEQRSFPENPVQDVLNEQTTPIEEPPDLEE